MTAPSLDRDPPAWATALHRHRDGLRWLTRLLLEAEAGTPGAALDALYQAIPADERRPLLDLLRHADANGAHDPGDEHGVRVIDDVIDRAVFAYETHVAAAYQRGPHLGRWQDATRTADERIGQHGAEAIEVISEPPHHRQVVQPADARSMPHLDSCGACQCYCPRCHDEITDKCHCPWCSGACDTHINTDGPEADALLADLAAIPVTVGTVAEVAAKIGGA